MDSLGRIFEVMVTIVLLFFVPLSYTGAKQDMICQTYVTTETTYFVEAIRNAGCITRTTYETFQKKLAETGYVYDIDIIHYEETMFYKEEETADSKRLDFEILDSKALDSETTDAELYEGFYYGHYLNEIMEVLYEKEERYEMKQGDYIMVKVRNKNKTYGTKLQEWFLKRSIDTEQIYVVYGGSIRNEIY